MSRKHVFVSYAREDATVARQIRKYIEKLDVPVWHDVRKLRGGDQWEAEIISALRRSSVLILVITEKSMRSSFVGFEWAFARGAGARFIPVLAEKIRMPRPLSSTNYVDFTKKRKPWTALADALNRPNLEDAEQGQRPRLVARLSSAIATPTREIVVRDTLYNMLKARHGKDRRPAVREALQRIRDS